MKFGSMKPERVAKNVFIYLTILIIINYISIPNIIVPLGTVVTELQNNLLKIEFYIEKAVIFIIYLILLRLFCEIIYNIIFACHLYINNKINK